MFRTVRLSLSLVVVSLVAASPAFAGAPLPGVPEVDPGSMMSALALLTGGLFMLTDRAFRRK